MTNSLCKTSVYKAYQDVINDVISNAREHFIEDGVDETVLQELKQLWETKLAATKAVEENRESEKIIAVNNKPSSKLDYNGTSIPKNIPPMLPAHMQMPPPHPQQLMQNKQFIRQIPPNNHIPPEHLAFPEWRRVPIQLTIPSAPGVGDGHRILSINVPEVFLQGHHLKSILTGQVISTTMGLPLMTACTFLQEQVNQAFMKYQQQYFSMNNGNPSVNPTVHNNSPLNHDEKHLSSVPSQNIPQKDGPADSSDEDDDDKSDDGSDNDMHDDKDDDDDLEQNSPVGAEEEPLNSEDDVSDADGTEESFETDNVIVCQYDKVTRSRNRWKFHLKDGIMNLNGEDFIFQKASGDAEW